MNDIIKKLIYTRVRAKAYSYANDTVCDVDITVKGDLCKSKNLVKLVEREGKKMGYVVLNVCSDTAERVEQRYRISYEDFIAHATLID